MTRHRFAAQPSRVLACELELIEILDGTRTAGETIDAFYRRKEHALGAVFARLSVADCRALHWRLTLPLAGDALAGAFARMIAARRARLLAYLADAPRRAAIGAP